MAEHALSVRSRPRTSTFSTLARYAGSIIIAPAILFAVLAGIATPDPVASGHALRLEAVR
ncbi:hypothetical protein [Acetobacter nitrogenifigens]|uniref:hypothetical protein n=1 Tax=Acetobacter nitrogenifigens TaxID=285268 RepID=UPI0012B5BBBD|nr:hypothetical protein [Acetobacter nitrogenifigens]